VVVSVMMLKEGWDVRNVKVIVPLRPCDSRTLTEQTLGRGLRKMHPPVIDDEGAATFRSEQLFVIEHPSFKAILDQVRDIIEERSKDEIEHARDYVPVIKQDQADLPDEEQVRLVRFEGMVEVASDWRAGFDLDRVPALVPRQPWVETVPETEIRTFLKAALAVSEDDGQQFTLPETPGYRDFDQVIERAYAIPLLKELRSGFHHKNAVKGVVRAFLERRTFALPAGVPLSFDRVLEGGHGLIALCNLARSEVMHAVFAALLPALREAFSAERRTSEAQLSEIDVTRLPSYQAINQNLLERPTRTPFDRAAFGSKDELELAVLLEKARGVTSWIYNQRGSVGYSIPYDWKGYSAQYFPDFFVRAKLGEVFHNFIIEVKGRLDDRDKEKARCGQRHCDLLTAHDREPWHYLFLLENEPLGRQDITWWKHQSLVDIGDLLRRQESMPLLPDASATPAAALSILDAVPAEDRFRDALPVHDLAAAAGGFSEGQTPEVIGWARVCLSRRLDRRMFIARVKGRSMEPRVPTGAWCVFRAFPAGETPGSVALDGRRVVVQLRDATDPETGGRYTLKRWRVTKLGAGGGAAEVELQPDNPAFKPMRFAGGQVDIRVIAELLEVIG
jgi:hypothetical protein